MLIFILFFFGKVSKNHSLRFTNEKNKTETQKFASGGEPRCPILSRS